MFWKCREQQVDLTAPVVMGVLNVTPDSFSDAGRFTTLDAALRHGLRMADDGAAIIDVGGESTRPGAARVASALQVERVVPVIKALAQHTPTAISIDTSNTEVMRAAVEAGACIVNDVRALREPGAARFCAEAGVGVCLMHMQGEPTSMQNEPRYGDVVQEVAAFLRERADACRAQGIAGESIVLDPGIGFGKTFAHNMTLLKETARLAALGSPLLVGVSRKALVGKLLDRPVNDRLYGGLAFAAWAALKGARIIRTHDVAPTFEVLATLRALSE